MNKHFRPEIFLFYVLAAIGCGDDKPAVDTGSAGSSGRATPGGTGGGGRGGSAGGEPGKPKPGESCTPSDPLPPRDHPEECNGGIISPFRSFCQPRYEAVRCYIADAPAGQLTCAPHDESGLLGRVQELIGSSGFGGEFVLESADSMMLTDSCIALIECCERSTQPGSRQRGDCLNRFVRGTPTYCQEALSANPACATQPNEADAGPSVERGLCCYDVCGHTVDT